MPTTTTTVTTTAGSQTSTETTTVTTPEPPARAVSAGAAAAGGDASRPLVLKDGFPVNESAFPKNGIPDGEAGITKEWLTSCPGRTTDTRGFRGLT
jgi:hypothetical protein